VVKKNKHKEKEKCTWKQFGKSSAVSENFSDKKIKSCQDFKVTAISGMKKPLHKAVVKKNKQQKGSKKW
jgi:hypothetical protein